MKKPALLLGLGVTVVLILILSKKRKSPSSRRQRNPDFNYAVVDGGNLTSKYLVERHRRGEVHIHKGIDIAASPGTPIRAVSDGIVFLLWPNGEIAGYGNTVVIKNNDGRAALYAHLQSWEPSLQVNQQVIQGQVIGYVGNTESGTLGKPMKPHLHLEIHANAQRLINKNTPPRLDPEVYLDSVGMNIG